MISSPDDTSYDVAVLASTGCSQYRNRHHLDTLVGDTGDAGPVISHGSNDAGEEGTVAIGIGKAVAAVQDRGPGHDYAGEVGMGTVNAGIEERHGGFAPRCHRAEYVLPADFG